MVRTKTHNKRNKKKWAIFIVAASLMLLGGAVLWLVSNHTSSSVPATKTGTEISHSPASAAEQKAADEQKTAFADSQSQRSTSGTEPNTSNTRTLSKKSANVYITYAQQNGDIIDVNAYTDQYQNGTCTITFTKGAARVTKDTSAYTDASTTICNNPRLARSDFPSSGDWSVTVTFTSSSSVGTSKSQYVTIN